MQTTLLEQYKTRLEQINNGTSEELYKGEKLIILELINIMSGVRESLGKID